MKFSIIWGLALWLGGQSVYAQTDSVAIRLESIKNSSQDSVKLQYAEEIKEFLEKIPFGTYPENPPVRYLGYKKCTNAEAELYSWSVPLQKGLAYYNLFRFKDKRRDYFLRSLPGEESTYPPYLFYDFLAFEARDKMYFALLGWAQSRKTNQKGVFIARFKPNGTVDFNVPLLRRGNSRSAFLTFEYAKDGSMMLKHDKKGKRIIFDHLAPAEKKYEGYFMFYGADASYDALILKKEAWWYQENVKQ